MKFLLSYNKKIIISWGGNEPIAGEEIKNLWRGVGGGQLEGILPDGG